MAEVRTNPEYILNSLKDILYKLELIRNADVLNENTGLFGRGVGMDSVEVLQMVAAIEEEFNLTIDDEDLLPIHFNTVRNLIAFIEQRL